MRQTPTQRENVNVTEQAPINETTAAEEAAARDRGEAQKPLLAVRDLMTYFFTDEGVIKAVDGASFDVRHGRTLGLVGESGCGKSVTARSILQIIDRPGRIEGGQMLLRSPDRGLEMDIASLKPNDRQVRSLRGGVISMIFQEPMTSFSQVHTIGSQIVEAIRLHTDLGKTEAHERAVEWLHRVGIPNPAQRMSDYPHQLSGGQSQRALIAMALCTEPEMLIADEPTTALDVTTESEILGLLQQLQADHGMAILFITHDLGVIAEIADDVAVMYLGRVVERAPVEKIFESPKHPYTRALLGSMPSILSRSRERLPSIRGSIPHPQIRPEGCTFHPRCPAFMPGACDVRAPRLSVVDTDQHASCFLYPEA